MFEPLTDFLDFRIEENKILFGHNDDKNIIGAFLSNPNASTIDIYKREPEGIKKETAEFYPFFHLSDNSLLQDFPYKHWVKELEGPGAFHTICVCTSWNEMRDAVQHVSKNYTRTKGERLNLSSNSPILLKNDPVCQYFLQSGRTCFKGMNFSDLHRMQISCAFHSTHGFSNPDRDADRILVIALSDNRGWSELLLSKKQSEKNLLQKFIDCIHDRDPDIIEGNHILSFEFPYIAKRFELNGIPFAIGRDASVPIFTHSSGVDSDNEITSVQIHGRYVLDASMLISQYGFARDEQTHIKLHHAAKDLGFQNRNQEVINFRQYSWYYEHEKEKLIAHLNFSLKEIDVVCNKLSLSAFFLSTNVPLNFDSQFYTGSAAKIELLMLREYIRQHQSLPLANETTQTSGGYADIFYTGLYHPIIYLDVESMYPSIMISNQITPTSDVLRIFLRLLEKLTTIRLDVKRTLQHETDVVRKHEFDSLQTTLKYLINSFYGYLGYSRALFNDSDAAETVVQEGRKILNGMIREIRATGGAPIEVDTDGIYLVPPLYVDDECKELNFVERLTVTLPVDIRLSIAGRYKKMLSYKIKNYALLDYDDHIIIRGSSLTSRSMKKFAKHFVESCIECLLREDIQSLHELYRNLIFDFQHRKMQIWDFAKTETLRVSMEEYEKLMKDTSITKKIHSSVHEALIRSSRYAKVGEQVSYYFAGNDASAKPHEIARLAEEWQATQPDENIGYYIKRVDELAARFKIFFSPQDFRQIFSVEDDLFGFNPRNIKIISGPALRFDAGVEEVKQD